MKIADEEAEKRRRKKKETERSSSIKPKRLSKHKYPTCTSIRSFKQELILTSNFITCAEYHCLWDAMGLCCVPCHQGKIVTGTKYSSEMLNV